MKKSSPEHKPVYWKGRESNLKKSKLFLANQCLFVSVSAESMFYSFVFLLLSRRIKYKRIVFPSMATIESQIRRAANSIRKFRNNFLLPQTFSGFAA
jgi:hypothetical protein